MLPNDAAGKNAVLSQFVDRFHHDTKFRALAESDAHAALRSVGIKVPNGVRIRFANSAACAVDMMLDRADESMSAALDDDLLMQVTGGVTPIPSAADELRQFLDMFQRWR